MVTDYHFRKAKIPKGMSFPLKRSRLDAALLESGLSALSGISYLLGQSGDIVLRGEYCGEQRRGWAAAGQSSITVYAVSSERRIEVESALEGELLPRLLSWLREIEQAGNVRRAADRHFVATWSDGRTSVQTF